MGSALLYWPEAEEDPVIRRILAEREPGTGDPGEGVRWEPLVPEPDDSEGSEAYQNEDEEQVGDESPGAGDLDPGEPGP